MISSYILPADEYILHSLFKQIKFINFDEDVLKDYIREMINKIVVQHIEI